MPTSGDSACKVVACKCTAGPSTTYYICHGHKQGLAELHGTGGTGDLQKLIEACKRVVKISISQEASDTGRSLEYQRRLAVALTTAGRRSEAAAAWQALVEARSADHQLRMEALRGLAAVALEQYEEAVRQRERQLQKARDTLPKGGASPIEVYIVRKEAAVALAMGEESEALGAALTSVLDEWQPEDGTLDGQLEEHLVQLRQSAAAAAGDCLQACLKRARAKGKLSLTLQ